MFEFFNGFAYCCHVTSIETKRRARKALHLLKKFVKKSMFLHTFCMAIYIDIYFEMAVDTNGNVICETYCEREQRYPTFELIAIKYGVDYSMDLLLNAQLTVWVFCGRFMYSV